MSWITPPTFHDGAPPHDEDDFNALSNDVEFLSSVGSVIGNLFQTSSAAADIFVYYYLFHRHRYLHIRLGVYDDPAESIEIWYGDEQVYYNDSLSETVHNFVVDLDGVAVPPNYGQLYGVTVELRNANSRMLLEWLEERDSA